jgi:hypothetical protein
VLAVVFGSAVFGLGADRRDGLGSVRLGEPRRRIDWEELHGQNAIRLDIFDRQDELGETIFICAPSPGR